MHLAASECQRHLRFDDSQLLWLRTLLELELDGPDRHYPFSAGDQRAGFKAPYLR